MRLINPIFKDLHKHISRLDRHDSSSVFSDFLLWVIAGFSISNELNWQPTNHYSEKELPVFNDIFNAFALIMSSELKTDNDWKDILGEYYMQANISNSAVGQFFTPENVCTAMAKMTIKESEKENHHALDCCCGSGRLLLAANSAQLGMKLYASDLDVMCCRMTVVNFLIHGCEGEVVHKDGLRDDSYFGGWAVNEGINNIFSEYYGIPHVRLLPKEESVLYGNGWQRKDTKINNVPIKVVSEKKTKNEAVKETAQRNEYQQLNLF